MTAIDRRRKMQEIIMSDPDCGKIMEEQKESERQFDEIIRDMPEETAQILMKFPGLWYFRYHRTLTVLAENMRFADE